MSIEAMKQALDALENKRHEYRAYQAITALRQAIEQAEKQEPVAWITNFGSSSGPSVSLKPPSGGFFGVITPLYTTPPRKEWVGLTDDEILDLWIANHKDTGATDAFARAIEAKLKEKNT
jgi:hypothetical protein